MYDTDPLIVEGVWGSFLSKVQSIYVNVPCVLKKVDHYVQIHTFESTYSLKCICTAKINIYGGFVAICGHAQSSENFELYNVYHPTPDPPSEVRLGDTLLSCFSSHHLNNSRFTVYSVSLFYTLELFGGDFSN